MKFSFVFVISQILLNLLACYNVTMLHIFGSFVRKIFLVMKLLL